MSVAKHRRQSPAPATTTASPHSRQPEIRTTSHRRAPRSPESGRPRLNARICRIAGVAYARGYAQVRITFHVQSARLRRSNNCCATFSCRRTESDRRLFPLPECQSMGTQARRLSVRCSVSARQQPAWTSPERYGSSSNDPLVARRDGRPARQQAGLIARLGGITPEPGSVLGCEAQPGCAKRLVQAEASDGGVDRR